MTESKPRQTFEPAPPTKDEQIKALQIAVSGLLTHGLRPDLVVQARHAVEISGGNP